METLTNPPFAANPPVKFNLSASTLGIILFVLSILGAIFIGLSALGTLFLLAYGFLSIINVLGMAVGVFGQVVLALGSWKMYKNDASGKQMAIMGLAVNFVGVVLGNLNAFGIFTIFAGIIGTAVVYYLIIISRFPGQPQLVQTAQMPYGQPPQSPYGGQPPMQQPPLRWWPTPNAAAEALCKSCGVARLAFCPPR